MKIPTGELLKLEVDPDDSIDDVKEHIHQRLHIPPAQQLLIFRARSLDGSRTVGDYGLDRFQQPLYLVNRSGAGSRLTGPAQASRTPKAVREETCRTGLHPMAAALPRAAYLMETAHRTSPRQRGDHHAILSATTRPSFIWGRRPRAMPSSPMITQAARGTLGARNTCDALVSQM